MKSSSSLFDDSARDAHDSHAGRQDIFDHYRTCPDPNIVCDSDAANDLRILADVHIVADDGGVIRIAAVTADAAVAVDDATLANASFRIHDDGAEMLHVQVLTKASCADDESQPGTKAILTPAIPEAKQFVGLVKCVFLLLAEKTQVPLDVVHLRADPPLHESLFECHIVMRYRQPRLCVLQSGLLLFGAIFFA